MRYTYIPTNKIEAEPMTLGKYNEARGRETPMNENPRRRGYLVIYADGYQIWMPDKVFEASYTLVLPGDMKLKRESLIEKLDDLSEKIEKLQAFLPYLGIDEKNLAIRQIEIMSNCECVLREKVSSFQ